MRLIEKNDGPECLEDIHSYEELSNAINRPCKDQVIAQLEIEQNYLCAYCSRRVTPKAFRIEHYIPQNGPYGDSTLALEYSNFLGVCHGKFNYDDHSQSVSFCESVRGNQQLLFNPQSQEHISDVYFTNQGHIRSRIIDHDTEFEEILRLNIEPLRNARIKAYNDIEEAIFEEYIKGGPPLRECHQNTLNNLHTRPIEHQAYLIFKLQANAHDYL